MKKSFFAALLLLVNISFSQDGLVGHWTFDDPQNLLNADVGPNLILVGSHNQATDPDQKEGAVSIGVGSYYIVPHGIAPNGGGSQVNEYTLVMDIKIPVLNQWHTLYQTDPTNSDDGEVFFNTSGLLGVGATGYTGVPVEAEKWYRVAIVVKNGTSHEYYIDGQLALVGVPGPIDGRFSLASTVLLFADENGEDDLIHLNEIKLFSRSLAAAEVTEMGGYGNYIISNPKQIFSPYLQSPTPTSIYVCWHDATTLEPVVEYGTTEALGQTQSGSSHEFDSQTVWHWSKLTGLSPETVYFYKIISDSNDADIYQFKTPPLDGTNSGHVRFGVVGDNRTEPDVFKRTIDKMKEKMIDLYGENIADSINLVLDVGDIVTNGDVLSQYQREYFGPIAGLSHTVPFMVSIGNHEREAQHYYNYMKYEELGGPQQERYYSFRYGRVLFVAINSNSELRNETQIDWLDDLLNDAQQDSSIDWIISFCHHPGHSELWPDGNTEYVQDRVIPTLNKYSKVDFLLYGHSHNYERGSVADGNLGLMLNGGAGSALDRWGMYGNQRPYPEIQKSYDYYCYSIFDIDIPGKKMVVKSYSLGHTDKYMENVLFDEFYRDKSNETPPAKPSTVSPDNGAIVQTHIELKSSSYSGAHEFMSSHFQVTTTENDYSSPFMNTKRDFEDIYGDTGAPDYEPVDMNKDIDLSNYSFDLENIKPDTKFWWRVRYRDKNLQWSEWSQGSFFFTQQNTLNQEPNDTPETATQIFNNDTLSAEFDNSGDVDWYQFHLEKLSIYYLASFESETEVGPDIELYHESDLTSNLLSTSVKGANDAGDFLLAGYFPTKTGTYFAKVHNVGSQSGQYKIRLSGGRSAGDMMTFEFDNTLSDIFSKSFIAEDDTLSAAIFPVDDIDLYKISGQEGQNFEIGTVPILDLGNRDTDTFIALMNDKAEILFENDNRGEEMTATGEKQTNTFSLINGAFPYTGTFYLRVQSRFTSKTGPIDSAHPGIGEYGVYFLTSPGTVVETVDVDIPLQYELYQNYPNPFNPRTEIRFDLPKEELVTVRIFDILGKEVTTLLKDKRPPGEHSLFWNGLDSRGQQMASGLYVISLSTPGFYKSIKITLLR